MQTRTLAAALALAALLLPSVVAENPVVTVPKPDPAGPSAQVGAIQADGAAFAEAAAAIALGVPGVVLAYCPVPPGDPPQCDAFAIPVHEEAALQALLGEQGDALVTSAFGLTSVSIGAMAIADTKAAEAGSILDAVLGVTGPSATDAARRITDSVQRNACPVEGGVGEGGLSCGPDSAVTGNLDGAATVLASAQGLLVKVDSTPTCLGAQRLVASLSTAAGAALDCRAVPNGGMVVAIVGTLPA